MFTLWKKRPFFWGRGQFAVYFGKFNRRLVTNGDGQMSPLSIPLSCTFLEEIYNLQIFVAPYSLLWYPCMILIMLGVRQFEIELCLFTLYFFSANWTSIEFVINTNLDWLLENITETETKDNLNSFRYSHHFSKDLKLKTHPTKNTHFKVNAFFVDHRNNPFYVQTRFVCFCMF